MGGFALGALALLVVALLFVLLPKRQTRPVGQDISASNVQWYRQREQELLESAQEGLLDDARLRLLEDVPESNASRHYSTRFAKWPLALVLVLGAVGLYWYIGAAQDMAIANTLASIDHSTKPETLTALVGDIEARLQRHPEHEQYTSLLAQYYMNQQRYSESVGLYRRLLARYPEDDRLLAAAAQAQYLADGRSFTSTTHAWLERAVSLNPHQSTALSMLGMLSFETGKYADARRYWQQLVRSLAPQSPDAQMIREMIALAEQRIREEAEQASEPGGIEGVAVRIAVSAPRGAISPDDSVFVSLRPAGVDTRMPIAVRRFWGANLPREIVLDNRHSMSGQQLSSENPVTVAVQVSPSGQVGAANATWQGEVGPVAPSQVPELVTVVLAASQ